MRNQQMLRAVLYFELERPCPLSEMTDNWDEPFTVTQEEVIDDEYIKFVIEVGEKRDLFVDRFERAPEVSHVEAIDETRLLITKQSCGALPVIRGNHGMLQGWDQVQGSLRVFDVVIFRREDLRRIVADLREIGRVKIEQLTPYEAPAATLTSRQAEVLQVALDAGYFDWPREVDAETLAERLDIAHSTLLEHLRKAEKKLLEESLSATPRGPVSSSEREFLV
jgi:predicted DNA binding protein